MEPNHSTPENSDDAITSTTTTTTTVEEQHQQSRSYECTFCKRGFTNAQALGGHMNIHRKHKATLAFSPPPSAATTTTTTTVNSFSNSGQGKNKPLRLFGDGSHDSRNNHQDNVMKDPTSPAHEVDLELRLGQVESPGNKITTTRKFF